MNGSWTLSPSIRFCVICQLCFVYKSFVDIFNWNWSYTGPGPCLNLLKLASEHCSTLRINQYVFSVFSLTMAGAMGKMPSKVEWHLQMRLGIYWFPGPTYSKLHYHFCTQFFTTIHADSVGNSNWLPKCVASTPKYTSDQRPYILLNVHRNKISFF